MLSMEEIENRLGTHPSVSADSKAQHKKIREEFAGLMALLNLMLPEGRLKSLTFTHLEEAAYRAHAAAASQDPVEPIFAREVAPPQEELVACKGFNPFFI